LCHLRPNSILATNQCISQFTRSLRVSPIRGAGEDGLKKTGRGIWQVFGLHNLNKIATKWSKERGAIEVHLFAKPKGVHTGFSKNISKDL